MTTLGRNLVSSSPFKEILYIFSYILLRNSGKDLVRLKVLQTEIRMHTLVSKPAAYKRETELCFS